MSKLLSDAIEDYLTYRRTAYKRATALASDQSLRQFLAVTGNIQTKGLMPRHAERFQSTMLTAGRKPATVNNRMSQLSAFSKWLVANRYAPAHFCGTTRMIPVPPKAKLRIPVNDFQRLLDTADRADRRITVALGLYLFIRGGEMRTLRVGDIRLDEGLVDVVVHKTNGMDEMPICWELDQELRRWFVAYAADLGRPLRREDFLVPAHRRFPGWLERPDTGNYQPDRMVLRPYHHVQHILDACGYQVQEAGKKSGEGVHTLRRSGARAYFDALIEGRMGDAVAKDNALRQVMTALHHSSVTITQHYIGLEPDRQKRNETMRGIRFLPPMADNVVELRKVNE